MRASSKFVQQDICVDSFEVKASAQIDSDLLDALIHPEDGLLKPGAMPRVQASGEGCKNMMKTLAEALSGMEGWVIQQEFYRLLSTGFFHNPQWSITPKVFCRPLVSRKCLMPINKT